MTKSDELVHSFGRSWRQFSKAWKAARAEASEKAIHDLRVSTRRIIGTLELARGLSRNADISKLQRRFKKVLKSMGRLRDVQVQLQILSSIPPTPFMTDLASELKREEQKQIESVHTKLKRGKKRDLADDTKEVLTELHRSMQSAGTDKVRRSIDRTLSARQNEFMKAQRRFLRMPAGDETALHETRIALKKLRYVTEASEPIAGPRAKEQGREMHALQQLMGECRDIGIFRGALDEWAKEKGKTLAIVPALEQLQEKQQRLLKQIRDVFQEAPQTAKPKRIQPTAEKTQLAASPVTVNELVQKTAAGR